MDLFLWFLEADDAANNVNEIVDSAINNIN